MRAHSHALAVVLIVIMMYLAGVPGYPVSSNAAGTVL